MANNRRYEVFISSTARDLAEVRNELMWATLQCGHIPSAMELFPSGPKTMEHIESCIRKADIFVIVIGSRYGAEVEGTGKTFTRTEYDIATRLNKPILPFLLNDAAFSADRTKLPEGDPERKRDEELQRFRQAVKVDSQGTGRIVQFFSNASDLCTKYRDALYETIEDLKCKGGWIRSEEYDRFQATAVTAANVTMNPFFKKFVERLNTFDLLSLRVVEQVPEQKQAIADFFLERYLARLIDSEVRSLFFESGSSIAYLSEAFIKRLHSEAWLGDMARDLQVKTNNIITYLDFVLSEQVPIELYPYGPPEPKYGATFGPLTLLPKREPPLPFSGVSDRAQAIVKDIQDHLTATFGQHGIILMTASGMDLSKDSEFAGPHVGSFYNMLFKRAILASYCPAVMFLDGKKVPQPYPPERCHPVCDQTLLWSDVCHTRPLAIAVATGTREKADLLVEEFANLGLLNVERSPKQDGIVMLIVSNDRFQNLWKRHLPAA